MKYIGPYEIAHAIAHEILINFKILKWRQHLLMKTVMMDHVMDTRFNLTRFELQYKAVTEFK